MGKLKDFYMCKKCSTFLDPSIYDARMEVKQVDNRLTYICPVCKQRNSKEIVETAKES